MSTTLAAVWRGGGGVCLERLDLPVPAVGEVLVRVALATVCGSDLHTVAGHRDAPCPSVLGHEAVGEVVAVGPGAPARIGERVVWGVTVACGSCDRCRAGRSAKCRSLRKVGHEPMDASWALSGAYAEHVLLPRGATVCVVPPLVPDAVAAPAACATATVMAVLERAGSLAGARVLVSGAGMLGLTAVAAARDRGALSVVAVDVDADRLELARRFGATSLLDSDDEPPVVDVALELSGATSAAATSLAALDVGGRLVLAGAVLPGDALRVDPESVVRRWLTISGVHNYEPRHLTEAVCYLESSLERRPWRDLVAPPVPLAEVGRLLTRPARTHPRDSVRP